MFSQTGISGNSARFWKISAVGRWFGRMPRMSRPPIADRAFGRLDEAGDHPQDRGLAAARRAEEGEELAGLDRDVDMVDGPEGAEIHAKRRRDGRPRSSVPYRLGRLPPPEQGAGQPIAGLARLALTPPGTCRRTRCAAS